MAPRTATSAAHVDMLRGTASQTIAAHLTASDKTTASTWVYDREEPWTVHVSFSSCDVAIRWMFDRELLSRGLGEWVGSGDVRLGPVPRRDRGPRTTLLHLMARGTIVPAAFGTHALEGFLRATTQLVPLGREGRGIDWDGHLAALLAGG